MKDAAFRVRTLGREGLGATTAARLLAAAAAREGVPAQALCSFGRERSGAPVEAFCRIGGGGAASSRPDLEADALIIQDRALVHRPHVLRDLSPEAYVLVNASALEHLGLRELIRELPPGHVVAVPATDRRFPNAALLGALAGVTGAVALDSLTAAMRDSLRGEVAERSVRDATDAYWELARGTVRTAARVGAGTGASRSRTST
jgi:pyruvate ferredoxin oxidoreductase gamma subunit